MGSGVGGGRLVGKAFIIIILIFFCLYTVIFS